MPSLQAQQTRHRGPPLPAAADIIWWDQDLKGFGLKITPAGRKVFLVQYRPAGDRGNPRKYTIGEHGQVTPYQARIEAQRVLAERAGRPGSTEDKQPSRRRLASEEVADLVVEFLVRHAARTGRPPRPPGSSTARCCHAGASGAPRGRKRDVIALLDASAERGSPVMANRVLAAVRKFFNWCISRGSSTLALCRRRAPAREQARHRTLTTRSSGPCSQAARDNRATRSGASSGCWRSRASAATRSDVCAGITSI